MQSLCEIFENLKSRDDCVFSASEGLPTLPVGLMLPPDLAEFYARFGEVKLFGIPSDPRYQILRPKEFLQIGYAIYGHATANPIQQSWYSLAHVQDGNYIAIDCHPERLGYCYDAFHETIDSLGDCKVIAHSFTELMNRAAEACDEPWWLDQRFETYGYADRIAG